MRITKMSLGLAVLVVLAFTGCGKIDEMFGGGPGKKAEERVEFVLRTVSATGAQETMEFQTAVCRWAKDKIVIHDSAEFEYAYDGFREWVRRAGLVQGFQYEIEGSEEVEGTFDDRIVYGTIRNSPFEIVVTEGQPLKWKVTPQTEF